MLDVRADVWRTLAVAGGDEPYFARDDGHFATTPALGNAEGRFGTIVELGGVRGTLASIFSGIMRGSGKLIATDIVPTRHCDLAVDAMALPFSDASVENIVMQDVLHHIPYPAAWFL